MTLRDALAGAGWRPPRSIWRRLVRALRARRDRLGVRPTLLTSMAAAQSAQDRPLRTGAGPEPLRAALAVFHSLDGEAAEDAAAAVDRLLTRSLRTVRGDDVALQITGWPRAFGPDAQRQLLRSEPGAAVSAREAAGVVHRLDGLALGGSVLSVRAVLGPDEVLPAARGVRADLRRDRSPSWLPHVDPVGRFSATPRAIALRQAQLLVDAGVERVIDVFCGCGASAVAFALAGLDVVAIELDPSRARMAARNARHLGVGEAVEVRTGDAHRLLPTLLRTEPSAAVFLDPPWGAAEGDGLRTALSWDELVPEDIAEGARGRRLLAKLPRDFDLATLPSRTRWQVRWEFGEEADRSEHVVKMISALSC